MMMVALRKFSYQGRLLRAGDEFVELSPERALVLARAGNASYKQDAEEEFAKPKRRKGTYSRRDMQAEDV